jgi:hypothetical protein
MATASAARLHERGEAKAHARIKTLPEDEEHISRMP